MMKLFLSLGTGCSSDERPAMLFWSVTGKKSVGCQVLSVGSDVKLSYFGLACPELNYYKMQSDSNSNSISDAQNNFDGEMSTNL